MSALSGLFFLENGPTLLQIAFLALELVQGQMQIFKNEYPAVLGYRFDITSNIIMVIKNTQ